MIGHVIKVRNMTICGNAEKNETGKNGTLKMIKEGLECDHNQ